MIKYYDIVKESVAAGKGEDTMWKSVARTDELLEKIKEANPKEYWDFMRMANEDLYGSHYNEEFARYDLDNLKYIDSSGNEARGAHWTKEEVLSATRNKTFPEGTTDCDKWVAYNAAYSDFCTRFSDSEILDIAYLFYFADEDAPAGKIWKYMNAMR